MNLPQNAFEQLRLHFEGAPKNTIGEIWRLDTKQSYYFQMKDLVQAADYVAKASATGDVYFCIGGLDEAKPASRRATAADIRWLPSFYVDLDMSSEDKPDKSLPHSLDEGLAALLAIGLPAPWMVVSTGNGYAVHYRLTRAQQAFTEQDNKRMQVNLDDLSAGICQRLRSSYGWKLDNVGQANRLTRIVGTFNRKNGNAKPVQCVSYDPSATVDFDALLARFLATKPTEKHNFTGGPSSDSRKNPNRNDAMVCRIEENCAWLGNTVRRASNLAEPEWYAAARFYTRDWPSRERFHDLSSQHADYLREETEAKLNQADRAAPPRTCASIQRDFDPEGCRLCIFNGHINSPEKFAHVDPNLLALQSRFVFVASEKRYCDLLTGNRFDTQGFADKHMHLTGENVHDEMRRSNLTIKADRDDYIPGDPRRIIRADGEVVLNLFRTAGVDPVEGDWSVLRTHFELLYPDAAVRERVYDRLAHLLQFPAKKIRHALLTTAAQGTGKNFVAKLLQQLIGEANVKIVPGEVTGSKYTAELAGCSVLVFEEINAFSVPTVYEALKPFMSEDRARAEQKYKDGRSVFTPRWVLAFSNHQKPIKLDEGDRRFDVYSSPMQAQSPSYYRELWTAGMAQAASFKHWLLGRGLSHFDPNEPPPVSADKLLLLSASRDTLEKALESLIGDAAPPFSEPLFTVKQVREALVDRRVRGIGDDLDIVRCLQRLGAKSVGQISLRGNRQSCWTLWKDIESAKAAVRTLV